MAASVAAAVGKTSSRREKAKHLGSMMRKKLGKVANAGGAAVEAEGKGWDAPKAAGSGGTGDRGSGGMGAAARAVSGALAGIRVSFKGKESSETLAGLMHFQELRCHDGPIWAAAFNHSGQFLATAGQDTRILLHRVGDLRDDLGVAGGGENAEGNGSATTASAPDAVAADRKGGARTQEESGRAAPKGNSAEAQGESSGAVDVADNTGEGEGSGCPVDETDKSRRHTRESPTSNDAVGDRGVGEREPGTRGATTVLIDTTPWQILEAHRRDVVSLTWSRNDFLLSASLDMTVSAFSFGGLCRLAARTAVSQEVLRFEGECSYVLSTTL